MTQTEHAHSSTVVERTAAGFDVRRRRALGALVVALLAVGLTLWEDCPTYGYECPAITISWTPQSPVAGEPVHLVASCTRPEEIASWEWSIREYSPYPLAFPNDIVTTYTGREITHTFSYNGSHFVKVYAIEKTYGIRCPDTFSIQIGGAPPAVSLTWVPLNPTVGEETVITATAVDPDGGPIVYWYWSFEGAQGSCTADENVARCTFTSSGCQRVFCTAVDETGAYTTYREPCIPVGENPPCEYGIYPYSRSFESLGGSVQVDVTTQPGCDWLASSPVGWVHVLPASGTGSGAVTVSVDPNAGPVRHCDVTIAGVPFSVTQNNPRTCTHSVDLTRKDFPASGGSVTVGVTTQADCPWSASSAGCSWIFVTPADGTGSGIVTLTAEANPGEWRSCTLDIAGHSFRVTQEAAPVACSYAISKRSWEFSSTGEETLAVEVDTQSLCSWSASSHCDWVTVQPLSGVGAGTVLVKADANSGSARSGTLTIAGQTFTANQLASGGGGCTYSIDPTHADDVSQSGATGTVDVTVTGTTGCSWTASANKTWLHVTSGSSGTTSGPVGYSVDPNTGSARSGTLTIAGKTFTVNQTAGAGDKTNPSLSLPCSVPSCSGGTGSISFSWSATDNVTPSSLIQYHCKLDEGSWSSWSVSAGWTFSSLAAGLHAFYVEARDQAGNTTQQQCQFTIQCADLAISKTTGPSTVISGQTVVYTLAITNNGPSTATDVVVEETYPPGFVFTSATPAPTNGDFAWSLGSLASGVTRTITITGTPYFGPTGLTTNGASVTASTPDPNPDNNSASSTPSQAVPLPVPLPPPYSAPFTLSADSCLTKDIGIFALTRDVVTSGDLSALTGITEPKFPPPDVESIDWICPSTGQYECTYSFSYELFAEGIYIGFWNWFGAFSAIAGIELSVPGSSLCWNRPTMRNDIGFPSGGVISKHYSDVVTGPPFHFEAYEGDKVTLSAIAMVVGGGNLRWPGAIKLGQLAAQFNQAIALGSKASMPKFSIEVGGFAICAKVKVHSWAITPWVPSSG